MLEFKELTSRAERALSQELFDKTWPSGGTQIPSNFLEALLHSGSYLGGGFESGKLIAAAFAFPGLSKDGEIFCIHMWPLLIPILEIKEPEQVSKAISADGQERGGIDILDGHLIHLFQEMPV